MHLYTDVYMIVVVYNYTYYCKQMCIYSHVHYVLCARHCRLLDIQSNDYHIGTTLSVLPQHRTSTQRLSHTPTPSPQHVKQEVEVEHLYGSELIRQSLMAVSSGKLSRVGLM